MSTTILVIDHDVDVAENIQRVLRAEGLEVLTAITGQAGVVLAELNRPKLVLLDTDLPDVDGYEVCRTLRAVPSTAKTPILLYSSRTDVTDKVAGFKAGADDFIIKPVAPAELVARVKAALRSEEKTLAHIVALWGAKGGVGTTALAVNLAVALRSKSARRVTVVDSSTLGGTLAVMLNLAPQHTVGDLLPRLDQLDMELLGSVLTAHSSDIRVLASYPWAQDVSHVAPEQWQRIIGWLQEACDFLVLDTATSMDASTMAILQLSETVLILTPEMTSLRNAHLFLQSAASWMRDTKPLVVLNRYPTKGGLQLRDVEAALQTSVDVTIPNDEPLMTYSVNRGIPVVISHPKSAVAQSVVQLADLVLNRASKKRPAPAMASALLGRGQAGS
ncbi:MAG: Cell cycle response regulator CtrA [Chloroflexi bacterium ADurb.Bin180]|nr:MAG: Cell cycle response regulator CtrA [Chloroflexi bacterium ADurb.Bin180]